MSRRLIALAAGLTLALGGCASIPEDPDPLPSDWIPSPTASPAAESLALSKYGFDAAQRMTVRVRSITCGTGVTTGSGFAIDGSTFVTNRHVITNAETVEISTYDGITVTATAASSTQFADIAIVTTAEPFGDTYASLATDDPVEGDLVTVVGYPQGGKLSTSAGVVLGRVADPLADPNTAAVDTVLAISAVVEPGSSGSAVVNESGEVVGVVYAKATDGSDQTYMVPVSTLTTLIDEPALLNPVSSTCTADADTSTGSTADGAN